MDEASTHQLQGRMLTTMNNKVKIPVARLKQIIQEEVTRFYGEDSEDTELLDSDEDELLANPDEELDEQVSSTEMMNRQVGAEIGSAISKLNALPADQARAKLKQAGL